MQMLFPWFFCNYDGKKNGQECPCYLGNHIKYAVLVCFEYEISSMVLCVWTTVLSAEPFGKLVGYLEWSLAGGRQEKWWVRGWGSKSQLDFLFTLCLLTGCAAWPGLLVLPPSLPCHDPWLNVVLWTVSRNEDGHLGFIVLCSLSQRDEK